MEQLQQSLANLGANGEMLLFGVERTGWVFDEIYTETWFQFLNIIIYLLSCAENSEPTGSEKSLSSISTVLHRH